MDAPPTPERRLAWWQTVLAVAGVLLVFASPLPFTLGHENFASEYGAFLQGVAGTFALGLLLVALHLQRRDLELTRDEMKENNKTQGEQREQMSLQLAEMRRQNDLMREQHEWRLKPMFEGRSSSSSHFNLDLVNDGFERGYINRVAICKIGAVLDETEDIAGVLNRLIDQFGIRKFLTHAVSANDTTPRLLKVGEAYPVLDLSLDFGKAKAESQLGAIREFYVSLSEYRVVADVTDMRNEQRHEARFELRHPLARISLP